MKYNCDKCMKVVDECLHKWEMLAKQYKIKAEQYRKFSQYWEKEYQKLLKDDKGIKPKNETSIHKRHT